MKKWMSLILSAILMTVLLSACGSNQPAAGDKPTASNKPSETSGTGASKGNVTLTIMNGKTSIADTLTRLKGDYEKENPGVKLEIETVSSSNYATSLKAKFAANQPPDIFFNAGYQELGTWIDRLEDLSGEPWVSEMIDIAKDPISKNGAIYGMPISFEGFGILYNKQIFADAGITELPKTLSQLEAVAAKLKEQGVLPFFVEHADVYNGGWYMTNIPFARQASPDDFQAGLSAGKESITGNALFEDLLNFVDLTIKYGNNNQLTADYNTQLSEFGNGKAAMTIGGNWNQLQLDKINPDLQVSLMPIPINEDSDQNDKLSAGVPNYWVISKDSKVKEEAKQFLNWLVGSETGKRYIAKELKFVPAFKNIEAATDDLGMIGSDLLAYVKAGKTLGWQWPKYPVGIVDEFGATFQKYVAGKINREGLLKEYQSTWEKLGSK